MGSSVKWLWDHIESKYRKLLVLALILCAFTNILLLINPALIQRLVDEVIVAQNRAPLLPLVGIMLGVKIGREILRYFMIIMLETASQNMLYNLRCRLFSCLQYNDIRFFDLHRTGDLMTRLSGDLDWCRHFVAHLSFRMVECVTVFLFGAIYLFTISWKMTLVLMSVTPVLLIITRQFSKRVRPRFIAMRERLSEMNTAAQENIAGNRVVRAFAREDYEKQRFDQRNNAFMNSHLDINGIWLTFFPLMELLANLMTLLTIFAGALFIIWGELTPGELAVFTSLSWALVTPMRDMGTMLNDIQRFITCSSKIIDIQNSKPLIVDAPDAEAHPRMEGKIEFKHVTFRMENKTIIDDVSFVAEPGQTVAIMGPTGSGKTTLIHLLARFYDVSSGAVLVDDCDVRRWKLQELREGIGTATQDVFLFSDTVEGNVAFGNQFLNMDEIRDFSHRAAAGDFIESLSDGYDTIIGERGVGLSGGQRQRIALARALAVRPKILVLDDTTSAVDSETERFIQQQLRQLPFPCTRFIIAQRISSLREADQILVLRDGRIAEQGTHLQLLKKRGYYYQTFVLQNDLREKEAI